MIESQRSIVLLHVFYKKTKKTPKTEIERAKEKEEIEIINNLVSIIIKRKLDLGLSQRDLAALPGIKQPAIARLETLGSIPKLDTLIKVLNALDLKIDLVFNEEAITA